MNVGICTRRSSPIVKPAESNAKNSQVYSNIFAILKRRSTFRYGVKKTYELNWLKMSLVMKKNGLLGF